MVDHITTICLGIVTFYITEVTFHSTQLLNNTHTRVLDFLVYFLLAPLDDIISNIVHLSPYFAIKNKGIGQVFFLNTPTGPLKYNPLLVQCGIDQMHSAQTIKQKVTETFRVLLAQITFFFIELVIWSQMFPVVIGYWSNLQEGNLPTHHFQSATAPKRGKLS